MKIIIAGGGTGGHLFPGIAIAEEFLRRDQTSSILFVGTRKGLEQRVLDNMGFNLHALDVEGIKGRGITKVLGALLKIPRSIIESYRLIQSFCPDIVIGVGGYASGPAVMTARLMGIKTAIAEQNALPGITNRILGKSRRQDIRDLPGNKEMVSRKKDYSLRKPCQGGLSSRNTGSGKNSGQVFASYFWRKPGRPRHKYGGPRFSPSSYEDQGQVKDYTPNRECGY